ncbi:MAG: aldo/keto reductase [Phycisphaeraceae bacterium]|nr:aldo/keto reductase [Phycisphaeraceae bacterium]
MAGTLNWGIIGTGNIAHAFAGGLAHCKTGKLVAVGSRTQESAEKFGKEFNIPQAGRHGSYEALLADANVQAVYICTPHPLHPRWAIRAAAAGKHVLCEKPMGLNHAQAMAVIDAAREHGVFLMEAFMYRCHPQTAKLIELIQNKTIGDVRVIQATFSFHWPRPYDVNHRLTANELGGGGILDVGCYPVSMSRLIAGVALGQNAPAEPVAFKAVGKVHPQTQTDEYTVAVAEFPGGIVAQLSTGVQCNQENVVRIFGTEGSILMPSPWIPSKEGGQTEIIVNPGGKDERRIAIETPDWLYGLEADTVAKFVDQRQASFPAMSWNDTLGNMKVLDEWRQQIGQEYAAETPAVSAPVRGEMPRYAARMDKMIYGTIAGIDKAVSRIAVGGDIGCMIPREAMAIWDDAFERGINMIDTAHIYGGGKSDSMVGHWVRTRGIRKDIVVLAKGAHTPNCTPAGFVKQFHESLESLRMDYVDLYMLHRDNLDVPVGEFIDVLNEYVRAGRIRAFGGSNWSIPRIEAANTYAAKHGKQGFAAVSNNLSLAHMVDPVWAGCVHCSDQTSRAWHAKSQVAVVSWSSQARGFFTDRSGVDKKDDAELVRCWYSEDNFQRKARAMELAKKKGCEPINIAAAFVLSQPFPTFALIGPRQISETRSSLSSLAVTLTAEEVRWVAGDR